jgi:hypothetical protein
MTKIVLLFLFILFAFAFLPVLFLSFDKEKSHFPGVDPPLLKQVNRLNGFLKKGSGKGIYTLFNVAFQKEIPEERFILAFTNWLNGKKTKRIETKFIYPTGIIASVSTWLWQDKDNYQYLYSNWIKTDSGWKLLWLSPVLNQDFDYARGEVEERKEILSLAIEKVLSEDNLVRNFRQNQVPRALIILKKGRPEEDIIPRKSSIPILWLTKAEIEKKSQYLSFPFYLDFAAIRIIENLATIYLDLIPIPNGDNPKRSRLRGLQFQFQKNREGVWEFISYGAKW